MKELWYDRVHMTDMEFFLKYWYMHVMLITIAILFYKWSHK